MKRIICLLITVLLIFAAGSAAGAEQVWSSADGIPVILTFLSRGSRVETAGIYDETYTEVITDAGRGLIRTEFLSGEPLTQQSWEGCILTECMLNSSYNLQGEYTLKLKAGATVNVLEELSGVYMVRSEGVTGYIASCFVSRWPVSGSFAASGSNGADIVMTAAMIAEEETEYAYVRVDGAQVLLGFCREGEVIEVVNRAEGTGYAVVRLEGRIGRVREDYLDPVQPDRMVYAAGSIPVYGCADLYGNVIKVLSDNNELTILCEFADSYYVSAGDVRGFVSRDSVRNTPSYSGGAGWSEPVM